MTSTQPPQAPAPASSSAQSLDVHVGRRLRNARILRHMTQEALGAKLGITFQQVQKYEKGTNRMLASRLYRVAAILDLPVTYFFEEFEDDPAVQPPGRDTNGGPEAAPDLVTPEGAQLCRAFESIEDKTVRRQVLAFVEALTPAAPQ